MSHFGERFGQLIRRKREDRGWSFAQVALAVYGDDRQGGESRKADVQKLEKGTTRKPNARTIKLFREALNLTQAEIDACRSAAELELARYAERLFTVMQGAVAKAGLSPDLARDLADRYAEGNPDNFETALRELARAVEVAAEQHARGALPSNSDEQVDRIIAEVERLNIEDSIGAGSDYIRRALATSRDRIAQQQAAHLRLIETGLAQAVLDRSVDDAAALELERWRLDGGGFEDLRARFIEWWKRGRDKGLAFDLQVSIALAVASEDHARNADDRGAVLNDLGNALTTLGARESGMARLEMAVSAYRAALEEYTRDRVPLDWAGTTAALGFTEALIGGRMADQGRVLEGIARIESGIPVLEDGAHEVWARYVRENLAKARVILASLHDPER